MEVTDLMIGDWVNYRPGWINEETGKVEWQSHDEGFPVKIEFLYFCHGEGFVQYNDGENDGIEAADYELFPIPLTPEILEKNGWQYVNGNPCSVFQLKNQEGYISIYSCIKGHFEIQISGLWYVIQFVHQLQRVLRFCGIEKEINFEI